MEHKRKVLALAAVLVGLSGARAQAQDAAEVPSAGVPVQRTQRELVLPEGYVRGDLALSFGAVTPSERRCRCACASAAS